MISNRWLAISVGTLISALAFWFAILVIPTSQPVGLLTYGVGLAFAMYAIAGFSGADDIMTAGFAAAMTALITAASLAVLFQASGLRPFIVVAPVLAVGFGGTRALAPTKDRQRNAMRLVLSAALALVLYFVFTVNDTTYALVAPLLPLPILGVADRMLERIKAVVAETD